MSLNSKLIVEKGESSYDGTRGEKKGVNNVPPILLISSLNQSQKKQKTSSYAQGVSSMAQQAVQSMLTTQLNQISMLQQPHHQTNLQRIQRPQKLKKEGNQSGIATTTAIAKKATVSAGSSIEPRKRKETGIKVDELELANTNFGSPVETKSGTLKHRGYSLLNMPRPVNDGTEIDDTDEEQDEEETAGPWHQQQQSAEAAAATVARHKPQKQHRVSQHGSSYKFPDLLFLGYGVQATAPVTVKEKRERRMNRQLRLQTRRQNASIGLRAELQELTDSHGNTSITDQKQASARFDAEVCRSGIDSHAFETHILEHSPHIRNDQNFDNQDATISSANTKGYAAFMGQSGLMQGQTNEWHQPYQTQTLSLAEDTLEAQDGDKTLRTNTDEIIKLTPEGTIESNMQEILACSIDSHDRVASKKVVKQVSPVKKPTKVQPPPSKRITSKAQSGVKSKTTKSIQQRNPIQKPAAVGKSTSPNRKTIRDPIVKEKQQKTKELSTPVRKNRQVGTTPPANAKSQVPRRVGAAAKKTPATPLLDQPTNKSMQKSQSPKKSSSGQPSPRYELASHSKVTNHWQNRSQGKLLKASNNSNRPKKTPPLQPGVKRFKTQTEDARVDHNLTASDQRQMPIIADGKAAEEGFETSSFAEDISQTNPVKIDLGKNAGDTSGSAGKGSAPPKLALLYQGSSAQDDHATISEAGLKELSIVESDGSVHDQETPANKFRGKKSYAFQDYQPQISKIDSIDSTPRNQVIKIIDINDNVDSTSQKSPISTSVIIDNQTAFEQQILKKKPETAKKEDATTSKKQRAPTNYLSSNTNDSQILAKSSSAQKNNSAKKKRNHIVQKTTNKETALQKAQRIAQNKVNREIVVNKSILLDPNKISGTDDHHLSKDETSSLNINRKQHSAARGDTEDHLLKRLSKTNTKIKRSITKDYDKRKGNITVSQRGDNNTNLSVSGSGGQGSMYRHQQKRNTKMVSKEGNSRMRIVQYMPIHNNRRARQNQVRQSAQFVDSDFYDNQSVHFHQRMRSTSPVSSKASTFNVLRQQSLRTRKSQIDQSQKAKQYLQNSSPSKQITDTNTILTPSTLTNNNYQPVSFNNKNINIDNEEDGEGGNNNITVNNDYNKYEKLMMMKNKRNTYALEHKLKKQQQRTQQMVIQNENRSLSRMYQKQFIERREKQVQIINKQIFEQPSDDQDCSRDQAYAIGSQYNNKTQYRRSSTMRLQKQKQGGLDTLRKVHDSIDKKIAKKQKSNNMRLDNYLNTMKRSKKSIETRNNTIRNNQTAQKSYNTTNNSVDEYGNLLFNNPNFTQDSCNSLRQPRGTNRGQGGEESDHHPQQQSFISTEQNNQSFLPSDQGVGDKQLQADYNMAERGGQKLTSDESSLLKQSKDFLFEDGIMGGGNILIRSMSPSHPMIESTQTPQQLKLFTHQQQNQKQIPRILGTSKQFTVPKMRTPQNWQNIIERKYNMLQTQDQTYFIPGQVSRSVYNTKPQTTVNAGKRVHLESMRQNRNVNHKQQQSESPTVVKGSLNNFSDRNKSHELNSVRNQYHTDEDRLKKLTDFSVWKKIQEKQQRGCLSIKGRDDPSNVIGYQKLRQPATMRNGVGTSSIQKRIHLLEPIPVKDRRVIATSSGEDRTAKILQKNIYGMLSDTNRAKTMRIANQVLKEQQQQLYAVNVKQNNI